MTTPLPIAVIKAYLESQSSVMDIASGGILNQKPDPVDTPDAFETEGSRAGRLKPLVRLIVSSLPQRGPYPNTGDLFLNIWSYGPDQSTAEALSRAVRQVLNRVNLPPIAELRWADDMREALDPTFTPMELYVPSRWRGTGDFG